ncbi:hypothetical protein GCM10011521_20120 [Arenimonas soli]|uniref:Lipoprotein n=1 Tax=Arenimonas soli TaxID=2269504 RepID=A0ABQ1HMS4_9GAMM|nr:hypothetical protein [Arenimonas soli]GGA81756.1 hypothetical protein GCM10011521_20120 [Arenimonas soli]
MRIFALLIPLLLGACATSTRSIPAREAHLVAPSQILDATWLQPSEARPVRVTFVRERGLPGRMMGTVVVIDNQPVALLHREQKVVVYVAPGERAFSIGYAKHLESRPLLRAHYRLRAEAQYRVDLRLHNGLEPEFIAGEVDADDRWLAELPTQAELAAAPCEPLTESPVNQCRSPRPALRMVEGRICSDTCRDALASPITATWSDVGNLEEYVEPDEIGTRIDAAIRDTNRRNWWLGNVGRHIDPERRYVYTRLGGWIDIKHVVSTTSHPLVYVPGASLLSSWAVEVAQVWVAPMSAFLEEDLLSNRIGSRAALKYLVDRRRSRGEIAQEMIQALEPLGLEQAKAEFGIDD